MGKKGLWANIHAKRERGEAPAKPGDKNYPTEKALKDSQTPAKKKPCWSGYEMIGMKNKGGKKVPNCVPITAKAKSTPAKILPALAAGVGKAVAGKVASKVVNKLMG